MKCDNLLVCGLGQCGGILADLMKQVNKRYSTMYVNSSIGDTKGLAFADLDSNTFIYSGADGSGRQRDKAKLYLKNDQLRLASFLSKFKQFKYILVFSSLGGGTGSGTLPDFICTLKKVLPNSIINVVGVLPSLSEEKLQLENSLECCNELSELLENTDVINDLKLINNETRKNNYTIINRDAIVDINNSYSKMQGHNQSIGSIDENNLTNVTTSKGCGVVLELPRRYSSVEDAITEAQQNSVFALPNSLECTYAAVNTSNEYNIDDIITLIEADSTIYKTTNEKGFNMIVLGGCNFPSGAIMDIEDELKLRENNKKTKTRSFGFKSNMVEKKQSESTKRTIDDEEDDLESLFDSDVFRF